MGTKISVQNRSGQGIMVEVWTKGKGFKVASWGVGAGAEGNKKLEAVWYDLCVIAGDKRYWIGIYGGNSGGTNLYFDGNTLAHR